MPQADVLAERAGGATMGPAPGNRQVVQQIWHHNSVQLRLWL
jgi:hypothetical protein